MMPKSSDIARIAVTERWLERETKGPRWQSLAAFARTCRASVSLCLKQVAVQLLPESSSVAFVNTLSALVLVADQDDCCPQENSCVRWLGDEDLFFIAQLEIGFHAQSRPGIFLSI